MTFVPFIMSEKIATVKFLLHTDTRRAGQPNHIEREREREREKEREREREGERQGERGKTERGRDRERERRGEREKEIIKYQNMIQVDNMASTASEPICPASYLLRPKAVYNKLYPTVWNFRATTTNKRHRPE